MIDMMITSVLTYSLTNLICLSIQLSVRQSFASHLLYEKFWLPPREEKNILINKHYYLLVLLTII